jgi:molybdopterin converting factor small subunit
MKIRVRLFGLLSKGIEAYSHDAGLDLDLPEGATYRDLDRALRLPAGQARMFSVRGILKKPDEPVADGDEVNILAPLAGG